MTSHERKLLRKEINTKLKHLANRESHENDFLNSTQVLTERQKMYMTISKHFRAQDNRRTSAKLPFEVERTSLPHINMSLLSRLYESTNDVMKSKTLDKVLNAHAYRVATPFYTNPELTVDRGKIMNYSTHVGTILHTPRYIDFMKNTPEYSTIIKTQKPQEQRTAKSSIPSGSSSGRSAVSSSVGTRSARSQTEIHKASSTVKSNHESNESSFLEEWKTISMHSSIKDDNILLLLTPKSSPSSDSSRNSPIDKTKSAEGHDETFIRSVAQFQFELKNNDPEAMEDRNDASRSSLIPPIANDEPSQHEKRTEDLEDELVDEAVQRALLLSERSLQKEKESHLPFCPLVHEVEIFFTNAQIEEKEWELIIQFFETVDKYRNSRPRYVEEYGDHLRNHCLPHFENFHRIITSYKISNISDEDSKDILELIKLRRLEHRRPSKSSLANVPPSNECEKFTHDSKEESLEMSKDDDESLKENATQTDENLPTEDEETDPNGNILKTLRSIFSLEKIEENFYIRIEMEEVEEDVLNDAKGSIERENFTESFGNLFRNSVDGMKKDDLITLKKLVSEFECKESDETNNFFGSFKAVFIVERTSMSDDDIENLKRLLDGVLERENVEHLEKFEALLSDYDKQVSDDDIRQAKNFISLYEQDLKRGSSVLKDAKDIRINDDRNKDFEEMEHGTVNNMKEVNLNDEERESLSDEEENETMLAFRNLFRTSIGEISRTDIDHIMDMINAQYPEDPPSPSPETQ